MLILEEPFRTLWKDKDPFAEVEKISGDVMRALETRRTLRFEVNGERFYLKLHHGVEFKEVLKNWIRLRAPVMGADREWYAIHRLADHGVDTMEGVAYGFSEEGSLLKRTSFIITKDLGDIINIHDVLCQKKKPSAKVKHLITLRMAQMVQKMHACGINHRDCYLVHFMLHRPFDVLNGKDEDLKISIIDLHRAQLRDKTPVRWRNKDLASMLFSTIELGSLVTRTDVLRFAREYFRLPLRQIFERESSLIAFAQRKAAQMQRHYEKSVKPKDHSLSD